MFRKWAMVLFLSQFVEKKLEDYRIVDIDSSPMPLYKYL